MICVSYNFFVYAKRKYSSTLMSLESNNL